MRVSTTAIFFLGLAASCTQANQILVNGDFETGDLTGWTATGDVSAGSPSYYTDGGSYAADIRSTAFGTPGRLSQAFSITGPANLSFVYDAEVVSGPASITFGLTNLDLNTTIVFEYLSAQPGEGVALLFDPPDFEPSISHSILFAGNYEFFVLADASNGGSSRGQIDNIVVCPIPETSSLALALIALGGLLLAAPSRTRLGQRSPSCSG